MNAVKIVLVGDALTGKSGTLISYTTNSFPKEYVPTIFENYSTDVRIDNRSVQVILFDSAGQTEYDKLRPLSYPQTDVFILMFSLNNRDSFDNIQQKWLPEIQRYVHEVPLLLVGNKSDLNRLISPEEGQHLAEQIHAEKYCEISAFTQDGLQNMFFDAVHAGLKHIKRKSNKQTKKHCCIIL